MKKTLLRQGLFLSLVLIGISVSSQSFARHFVRTTEYRTVQVNFTPATDNSVLADFTSSGTSFSGILRLPASVPTSPILFDGGEHGHHGEGGPDEDDDSLDGQDTLGGPQDSLDDHDGGPNGGGPDMGGDTSHCGGHDSSDIGEGPHDENDTVDCHHHGGNDNDADDSTAVVDSNAHTLFGGAKTNIVMKSHGQKATVSLTFTNNLATSVTINRVALASGKYFTIASGAPTKAMTLKAGASINLKVAFNAADQAIHNDQLVVTSNSAQITNQISIQAQQLSAASVASLPTGVSITTYPNPMVTSLKINLNGVTSASAVIFNLSGNQVLSTSLSSSEWNWNGTSADGTLLPAGTYLIRINGVSADNTAFTTTEKIVLAR
ncbi:MAG: T9SS type A sorting domain-containing protein [bacterium]